ncbi:hypothetical protein DFJ77DRAFT_462577 [Powellomyces hirtus]|nr:hypothetical protein DFJ77DRAFT_462577 [Powellomyces hirtus]
MRPILGALTAGGLIFAVLYIGYEFLKAQNERFEQPYGAGHGSPRGRRPNPDSAPQPRRRSSPQPERRREDSEEARLRRRPKKESDAEQAGEASRPTPPDRPATPVKCEPKAGPSISKPEEPKEEDTGYISDIESESVSVIAADVETLKRDLRKKRAALQQQLANLGWTEEQVRGMLPEEIPMEDLDVYGTNEAGEAFTSSVADLATAQGDVPSGNILQPEDIQSSSSQSHSGAQESVAPKIAAGEQELDMHSLTGIPPTLPSTSSLGPDASLVNLSTLSIDDEFQDDDIREEDNAHDGSQHDDTQSVMSLDSSWSAVSASEKKDLLQ